MRRCRINGGVVFGVLGRAVDGGSNDTVPGGAVLVDTISMNGSIREIQGCRDSPPAAV
jgi:hypothetical protein